MIAPQVGTLKENKDQKIALRIIYANGGSEVAQVVDTIEEAIDLGNWYKCYTEGKNKVVNYSFAPIRKH